MITTVNLRTYFYCTYSLWGGSEPQSPAVDFLPVMFARKKIKSHRRTPPTTKIDTLSFGLLDNFTVSLLHLLSTW